MVDAAVQEKLEAGFAKLQAADNCKSLLKKYLTREVLDKTKDLKTSFGSTLLDVVQSGIHPPLPPPTPFAEAKLSGYFNRGSLCFIWLGFQIHERGLRNTNSLGFTCIQFDFNELPWNGLNRTKVLTWI